MRYVFYEDPCYGGYCVAKTDGDRIWVLYVGFDRREAARAIAEDIKP